MKVDDGLLAFRGEEEGAVGVGGLGGLVEARGEGVKPEPVTPVGEIPAGMILFSL